MQRPSQDQWSETLEKTLNRALWALRALGSVRTDLCLCDVMESYSLDEGVKLIKEMHCTWLAPAGGAGRVSQGAPSGRTRSLKAQWDPSTCPWCQGFWPVQSLGRFFFFLTTLEISPELQTKWKQESFCRKKKKIETKDFLLLVNSIMFICLISWHVVIKIINRMKWIDKYQVDSNSSWEVSRFIGLSGKQWLRTKSQYLVKIYLERQ